MIDILVMDNLAMAKVLIAEDDATMVGLLKILLKMEGYQVVALDANADVVQGVLESRPDVVLMDVHLSHRNGIEELQRLRQVPGGQQVKVIMISGLDFKELSLANGADAFLQKPFMPDELLHILHSMS